MLFLHRVFTSNIACFGDSTHFGITSVIPNLKSFKWSFGDGSFDDVNLNTKHQVRSSGIYNVTLFAENTNDCSSSITKLVSVINSPDADFIATQVCLHNQTAFTDQSFSESSEIDKWSWNFGCDGNKDTIFLKDSIPVFHTFANAVNLMLA